MDPQRAAGLRPRLVRGPRPDLAGPRGRGGDRAPGARWARPSTCRRRSPGSARSGRVAGPTGGSRTGRSRSGRTRTGSSSTPRGVPTRIPAEFPEVYGEMPGPFEPGRVPLPPTPVEATTHRIAVRPADLDPLGHVNNAAYLDYLEETRARGGRRRGGGGRDVGAIRPARVPAAGGGGLERRMAPRGRSVSGPATPADGRGDWPTRPAWTSPAGGSSPVPSSPSAQTGVVNDADGVQGRVGVRRHGRGSGAGRRRRGGRADRRRRVGARRRRRRRARAARRCSRACSTATCT